MPQRRKKVLKDIKITHAFFNQVDSSLCQCCSDESHHHAFRAVNPGDSGNGKFIEFGPGRNPLIPSLHEIDDGIGDTTSSSAPAKIAKEQYKKLTHAQKQELKAAVDTQPAISKPQAITRALQLAQKQVTDAPAIDKQSQPTTACSLDNLDEVAETYDHICSRYKAEEERIMAKITEVVGDLAVTASDPDRSRTDRLAAELDINVWNIHSKLNTPLSSMVRQTQLFNLEKRFGCVKEKCQALANQVLANQALANDDKKCSGEEVPVKWSLSSQQKWNNPSKLVETASKPRKKKAKKRLAGIEAVDQIQRNIKLAIDEFQELKETIRNAETPIKLPDLPASFTYAGVPVPRDIPDDIRQRYFDVEFAYANIGGFEEFKGLEGEALERLIPVSDMLEIWANASDEVWYVHPEAILTCSVPKSAANEAFLDMALVSLSDTISSRYSNVKSVC